LTPRPFEKGFLGEMSNGEKRCKITEKEKGVDHNRHNCLPQELFLLIAMATANRVRGFRFIPPPFVTPPSPSYVKRGRQRRGR